MITVAKPETQSQISPRSPPSIGRFPKDDKREDTIFRSKLPDIQIDTSLPLHSYCFEHIRPERRCLIDTNRGRTFSYGETHQLSRKAASVFQSLGVRKGHVVMLLLQNCPEFVFAFMGASMLGAASTTANPFCTPQEIHKQLKASEAKVVITHRSFAHKVLSDPFPSDLTVLTVDEEKKDDGAAAERCLGFEGLLEGADEFADPSVEIEAEDPVAIPFSSGTTGLPKGVVLTHQSLITSVAQQVDGDNPNLCMGEDDAILCVLPMFHVFSLNSVLLCALRVGAGVAIMRKFDIEKMLDIIQGEKVTVAAVVPPLVLSMAKSNIVENYDLTSIRKVLSGAAPLGKDLQEALHRRLPQATFGQGYGMTEAGPVLSMCPAFAKIPFPAKSGSCGTVVRNAEMKVVDPETGHSLPRNQPGEICIRGKQIMKGYLNDPDATSVTIDVDGWLHTGDIGYVDDDDEIFIVDRVKELIKFKGFQVPPAELEALLISHESIADAAVVPQIDEVAGEVPAAFIVKAGGCELTEEAVKEFVAKQVVFYKRLHKVYFIGAIPKSPSGKILRKDLRARLAAKSS